MHKLRIEQPERAIRCFQPVPAAKFDCRGEIYKDYFTPNLPRSRFQIRDSAGIIRKWRTGDLGTINIVQGPKLKRRLGPKVPLRRQPFLAEPMDTKLLLQQATASFILDAEPKVLKVDYGQCPRLATSKQWPQEPVCGSWQTARST